MAATQRRGPGDASAIERSPLYGASGAAPVQPTAAGWFFPCRGQNTAYPVITSRVSAGNRRYETMAIFRRHWIRRPPPWDRAGHSRQQGLSAAGLTGGAKRNHAEEISIAGGGRGPAAFGLSAPALVGLLLFVLLPFLLAVAPAGHQSSPRLAAAAGMGWTEQYRRILTIHLSFTR